MSRSKYFPVKLLIFILMLIGLSVGSLASASGPFVEYEARAVYSLNGEQIGDDFGWAAENLGDIDGDGVNDMIISAPRHMEAGSQTGKVYVFSGADGSLITSATGDADDRLGWGASAAGDVNNDGVPDFIAGGIGSNDPSSPNFLEGHVLIVSGAVGHPILADLEDNAGEGFGYDVASAGDVDGDGCDEVIIGAPFANHTGLRAGRVYIYSVCKEAYLWTQDGAEDFDFLGGGVGQVGLVNGDATPDLVAGAWGAGTASGGEAYVYDGNNGDVLLTLAPDIPGSGLRFGQFFASGAGDVNNDGTPDIFIGDYPARSKGGIGTGEAYVFSGIDGSTLYALNGEKHNDGFGVGRGAGDLNGDGYDDLIIAAYTSSDGAEYGGKAYLYSGRDGSVVRTITDRITHDNFGVDALVLGDVNEDGAPDYLITAVGNSFDDADTGWAYVIAGIP
jgi:hypothetical protein